MRSVDTTTVVVGDELSTTVVCARRELCYLCVGLYHESAHEQRLRRESRIERLGAERRCSEAG